MKKNKREKIKKEKEKTPLFDPDISNQKEAQGGEESPFGGMNTGNFNKNLGCGS
jgi:hypothetical protein